VSWQDHEKARFPSGLFYVRGIELLAEVGRTFWGGGLSAAAPILGQFCGKLLASGICELLNTSPGFAFL
jgi:hypothetical protein